MAKRLRLAKGLLADDEVIFISIDDNEQAQLKLLCDDIFGEKNFIGEVNRKTKSMTGDEGAGFNLQYENLIIFQKIKKKYFYTEKTKILKVIKI
ncbi:DNA methyltransferase [Abyssogena phaseoliformis symbiont]|uniref:DNA methyltransferase n=1 Tax=Abyssogena phaseoliformis symbiont TaxID=596095 RepID=UPI001914ECF0|nr:DNA methyltransferase [Abyssogena phaseoliformis symbiont]